MASSAFSGAAPLAAHAEVRANGPKIAALTLQTAIYERPEHSARKLGAIRLGQAIARSEKPVASGDSCAEGWYAVLPIGYVCAGDEATLDLAHPIIRSLGVKPDWSKPMPYTYGFVRAAASLYQRVPAKDEQEKYEFALPKHRRSYAKYHRAWNRVEKAGANHVPLDAQGNAKTLAKDELPVPEQPDDENLFGILGDGETPWWLQGKRKIRNLSTFVAPSYAVFSGRVSRHAGLAVVGSFRGDDKAGQRKFTVLLDGRLIGEDKLKPHYASAFHGISLEGPSVPSFPFAMVKRQEAYSYEPNDHAPWRATGGLTYRDMIPLTGKLRAFSENKYYETKDGRWVRHDDIAVFDTPPPSEIPKRFDPKATRWIDVSIWQQTLVMYEGEKPVYATLVSTGIDGMGDPQTTKSTVRGEFRIDTKHVTATMDADDPENKFELRDVPWVQYFEGGYALHAAYWHDDFGRPHSHGCINLSPIDAHKLFFWTSPSLPEGWHGVRAEGPISPGTWVRVRG